MGNPKSSSSLVAGVHLFLAPVRYRASLASHVPSLISEAHPRLFVSKDLLEAAAQVCSVLLCSALHTVVDLDGKNMSAMMLS